MMGHVRIGFLPHTQQWNAIVQELSSYDNDVETVTLIADRTLDAVRKAYEGLQYDESIVKANHCIIIRSEIDAYMENKDDSGKCVGEEYRLFLIC